MDKKKILITTRDVGAAINIIEIVRLAAVTPYVELHLHIQQPAARYFDNAGIDYVEVPLPPTKSLLDQTTQVLTSYAQNLIHTIKPDVILCGLSTPGDGGIDEALISVAKGVIPTVVMQDFWGEVNDFFGQCADFYLCLDDSAKKLTEQKYPCKGIVTGSPRHSWYETIDCAALKLQLRHDIQISHHQTVVGLFGQSLHHLSGYKQTIIELLEGVARVSPRAVIVYRKHPRETAAQATQTIRWLEQSGLNFFLVEHAQVEHALLVCDVVISILSNCLYDASYLNFFSETPLITPVALCYKPDVRQHLKNYNMIEASPYKDKKIAIICDAEKPDHQTIDYFLSESCKEALWLAGKQLENPKYAAKKALDSILSIAAIQSTKEGCHESTHLF